MMSRRKEDEKNEKIIRSLIKLPENRNCINCNSLGPQYACINFWTFVCTNCSGIHREFTHRVKSISMAKFTSQEVDSLRGGGNQRAREIYFKEWDAQHQSVPDSSNVDKLREFIKHVYVAKRYTGEKSIDKPPRGKSGDYEDSYENRRTSGSRSPYEDPNDRHYNERRSLDGKSEDKNSRDSYDGKSPMSEQENQRKSPVHPVIVDDWRRNDRFGNGRSPSNQKDINLASPATRPVKDILGGNVAIRIIEPPKANIPNTDDGLALGKRTVSSSSFGSIDGNLVEHKSENLINFDAAPNPPVTATALQYQETAVQPIYKPMALSNNENWACFDYVTERKVYQAPARENTVESVLSDLTISSSTPVRVSGAQASNFSTSNVSSQVVPTNVEQWPNIQQHTQVLASVNQPTSLHFTPLVGQSLSNQSWNSSFGLSTQGFAPLPTEASEHLHVVPKLVQEVNSVIASMPPLVQTSLGGRKELPENLFAASYSSIPVSNPRWQTVPSHGMDFIMQYNTPAVGMPSLQASNPFDLNVDPKAQASVFPFQGTLPNMLPPTNATLIQASSFGNQSPYTSSVLPPQAPSYYASPGSQSAFMGQKQAPNGSLTSGHQGTGGYSNTRPAFNTLNPNSFPSGGNPFA